MNYTLSGNIAMGIMLIFTAIGHFAFTWGMEMMMPDFILVRKMLVYLTGMIEIAAAGLLISSFHILTAYLLIVFFILVLPVNIYAAIKKVDYQKSSYDGHGTSYL